MPLVPRDPRFTPRDWFHVASFPSACKWGAAGEGGEESPLCFPRSPPPPQCVSFRDGFPSKLFKFSSPFSPSRQGVLECRRPSLCSCHKAGPERRLWGSPLGTDSRLPSAVAGQLSRGVRGGSDLEFPPSIFPSQITRQEGNRAVGPRRTARRWASGAVSAGWGTAGARGLGTSQEARSSPFRS